MEKIQEVLEKLITLAGLQEGVVRAEQLREEAEASGLGTSELLEVLKTLKKRSITVEVPLPQESGAMLQVSAPSGHKELAEAERAYVKQYQEDLLLSASLPLAMRQCIPDTMALAEKYYCEEILWEDLVQEACFSLFQAMEDGAEDRERILEQVEAGIAAAIGERISEKESDQALIDQVEKLEEAVRELNEDGGEKFTIQELAIILDMDVQTIHDILKLTGDDESQESAQAEEDAPEEG